ncbi:MAG: type II secretion system protein GspJ [Phycisphaerales bacterium]|nr:type II secretion system protein GspJ [Phycisphaerales bacterium]
MTGRRGFTLIEVLLALGLIMLLVGSLGIFVNQVSETRVDLRTRSEQESSITIVFDALDGATGTCIALAGDGMPGFRGDAMSVEISFDSTTVQRALGDSSELVLVPEDRVQIRFEPSSGVLSIARDGDRPRDLAVRCFAVRFRFHDGNNWLEEWDSIAMGGLPHALECSVWYAPWPDETVPEWFPEGYDEEGADFEIMFDDSEDFPEEPMSLDQLFDSFGEDPADGFLDIDDDLPDTDRRRIFAIPDAEQPDESTFFEEPLFQESLDGDWGEPFDDDFEEVDDA